MQEQEQPRAAPTTAGEVSHLLWEVATAVQIANAGIARRLRLGGTDVAALEHLLRDGPLGPSELASRLGIRRASATSLADRLETAGHTTRVPHPEDRRRVAVAPTEHARQEAARVLGPVLGAIGSLAGAMPPEDRATVAAYLRDVAAVLRASAHEDD